MQKSDPAAKITPRLSAALASGAAESGATVDVVVELEPLAVPPGTNRQARIDTMKERFQGDLDAITRQIDDAGGEVTGGAWINRTVRGRVPMDKVRSIASDDTVVRIDLPSSLEAERPSTSRHADEEHGAS